MKILYNLGFDDKDIKNMLDRCPSISYLDDKDLLTKTEILRNINCTNRHIRNILISNPNYLDKNREDIINLIQKLTEINIENINLLFDSNPFLLNKNVYEIDDYINGEIKNGKTIDMIVDELESNPYIIDEN